MEEQGSSTGFKLDRGRVTGAAQKAAELEPDMAKWTPRARPKDVRPPPPSRPWNHRTSAPLSSRRYPRSPRAATSPCPRTTHRQAPKQSARYQSDFKALPEDVLEYAVYLGMDPGEDADLLWIAEEALTAGCAR